MSWQPVIVSILALSNKISTNFEQTSNNPSATAGQYVSDFCLFSNCSDSASRFSCLRMNM